MLIHCLSAAVAPAEEGQLRLICMGIGILPDAKTLQECKVPVFDTHPTPVNVSIRPKDHKAAPGTILIAVVSSSSA
jgi:Ubiquitin-2 like Rad60 SUMO-like